MAVFCYRLMRTKVCNIVFLFLFYLSVPSSAIDPVTVMVSLSPPYTPFLNEYAAAGINKLQVTLIVNDSRMNNYPARLQMIVERIGTGVVMRTAEYAAIAPVTLSGNVTEIFNGADLQPYFLAQNNIFAGFSQGQYMQTGRIPDGQYRIGFRVVDARRTDVVLSNTAFSQPAWFVLNDPPQLNLPRNNSSERVNELQSVRFEWFPRHLGSMNASFASSYRFELFAIRIPAMDARHVAMSVPADFSDITNSTSYQLTADKYMLEPGVKYAWRIRAIAGIDELTLFQNNGYSEVFSFTYGSACPVPSNVNARATGSENAEITWDTDPMHSSFSVRFRKAGNGEQIWHTCETFGNSLQINKILLPETRYEYQVSARCNTVESDYSPPASFTTLPLPPVNFVCGATDSVHITNHVPKTTLRPGEIIYYGKFPIKLYEVTGSNGTFKGKGRMRVPFLNNIQVNMQFEAIQVNELNEVTDGELVSIFNPDSRYYIDDITDLFAEGDQYGNVISGREAAAVTLAYSVADASQLKVTYADGTVSVTGSGGTATTNIQAQGAGITIADNQGNLFAADEKGNVTLIGKMAGPGGIDEKPRGYDQTAASLNRLDNEIKIYFENNDHWALDERNPAYNGSPFDNEYENLGGYYVPWKFIPTGSYGKVTARVEGRLPAGARVVFRTPAGTEYFSRKNGNRYEITIASASARDAIEVYALVAENDTLIRSAGKLRAASYPLLTHSVVLVPMDEGLKLDATAIKNQLDAIYRPYGISWNVRIDNVFTDRSWDSDHNGLQATGSAFFSVFTAEMQALNSAYTQARGTDNMSVYLFVFRQAGEGSEALLGDMPLESRFGYIFNYTPGRQAWLTIAHELGHGIFQLHHPFSDKYGLRPGTTDNLMDYSPEGLILKKYQWDLIHDPESVLFAWLEDEEEGAMASGKTDAKIAFSKLEDTDMGNRYGYDDMGTPTNPDDDHISVKNGGGYTYIKVEIDGKISGKRATNFDSIFFVSTNPLVIGFDTIGINKAGKEYNLKITGNGITSDTATIQARIKSDSSLLGQIHVNAYKEISITQTITYISPTGATSPISQSSISNSSKKYLQYLVANGIFSVTNIPTSIDINGNGRIDDFKNTIGKDELTNLQDELTKYTASDLLLIDGSIYDNWEIGDTVNVGDTYIQLPNTYTSALTSYVNNYTSPLVLQTPDGKNREAFVIKAINGTRLDISTNLTDPTKTEGFKSQHPVTHIITDTIHVTAGFASTDPEKGVVVTMQKTDELTIQVIVHESMHKYDGSILFDVDKEGNLMHWVSSHKQTRTEVKVVGTTQYTTTIEEYVPIPITIPFNYTPVEQVKTGDGTPMGVFKSQWNDVKR